MSVALTNGYQHLALLLTCLPSEFKERHPAGVSGRQSDKEIR